MTDVKIKVPVACKEKWNCMINAAEGKFCNVCNKVVVDFTAMTTDEIKNYLLQRNRKPVCGYFKPHVDGNYNKFQKTLIKLYNYFENTITVRLVKVACVFLVSFALTLSGCSGPVGSVVTDDTLLTTNNIDSSMIDTTNLHPINDTTIK